MKTYTGYEFLKAIKEGEIESDIKFKFTNNANIDTLVRFDGADIVYYENNENIFNDWFLTTILDSTFIEIEENEEIDIQKIKPFIIPKIAESKEKDMWTNRIMINLNMDIALMKLKLNLKN